MVKRRQWTRTHFAVRGWYRQNGKWVLIVLVVSLVGAAIALLMRDFYEYKPSYYEPKDLSRGQQIEQKEREQK